SRWASTSGESRSRSQYQSSTRSSPCAMRTVGRRGATGGSGSTWGSYGGPRGHRRGVPAREVRAGAPANLAGMPGTVPSSVPMTPVATPIAVTEAGLAAVRYDRDGLVPAVVQEAGTGRVLMLA